MAFPDYTAFNVVNERTDIQQLYVSTKDHIWIKEKATDESVRMVSVVAALVDHAKNSDEVFKQLVSLIEAQDKVLREGGFLSTQDLEKVATLIEKHGV